MHRVILMNLTLSGLAVNASPVTAHQPDLGDFSLQQTWIAVKNAAFS
jgi:uncharacterized membrane protein